MAVRTLGADIERSYGKTMLTRIYWKTRDGERGESLRIAHPASSVERFLFTKNRLSPDTLKRVSVLAYLLIPVLILLNTVIAQTPQVPYVLVLGATFILLVVTVAASTWFFCGAGLVDRLQGNPVHALKAPAVPAPDWWGGHVEQVTGDAVTAYRSAYLAREVVKERIQRGLVLQGKFPPGQDSRAVEVGLAHLREHKRGLTEALSVESLDEENARAMCQAAEEPCIPAGVTSGPVAGEVRDWMRNL